MPFSSHNNAGASCIGRTPSDSTNAAAQQSPPRPHASAKTKTGAALPLSPPSRLRCDSGLRRPLRSANDAVSSGDTAPSAGGLPAHQGLQFCILTIGIFIAAGAAAIHYIYHGDAIVASFLGIVWWTTWVVLCLYVFKPMAKRKTVLGPSVPGEHLLLMPSSPPSNKEAA